MEIDTIISNQNPWWTDRNYIPRESKWPHRQDFNKIEPWVSKRFIVSLSGLRRVGKSTLLKQIISKLLTNNPGEQVLYFSFERIQLKLEPLLLEKIMNFYLNNILEKKGYEIKSKVYIFFDEIQNVPNWQDIIKHYYDQNENFKFFVSGSSSLFIKKRSLESLAGRIIDVDINPLSFKEYLNLSHPNFNVSFKNKAWFIANINLLNSYFEKFLKSGQFPEIITQNLSQEQAKDYLETIEEKITQTDLPRIFPIKHPEILSLILNQIKSSPGQRVEYDEFAQNAGLDQRTISKYFSYLQKGFLINFCLNYGKKPLKSLRTAKKAYLTSPNMANNAFVSTLVENYVFNFFKSKGFSIFFLKEKEIDFVVQQEKKNIILAEVKYQNEIKPEDSRNLIDYSKIKPFQPAYLITKTQFKMGKPIIQIPASLIEYCL